MEPARLPSGPPSAADGACLGAPPGGALPGLGVEALLERLLASQPSGRIRLVNSLVPLWGPRLDALGWRWEPLMLNGLSALDTLMGSVEDSRPGDQVWMNLARKPVLGPMELHTIEAFLAYASSRPLPPLVVLIRDDAPGLPRSQRLAVDRLGNVLLVREAPGGAYALGRPALLEAMGGQGALPAATPIRSGKHLLVLDVDGVLIDPGRAFREAVALAVTELAPGIVWEDGLFAAFKRAGGFNNDFRLTAAALALAEAGALNEEAIVSGVLLGGLEPRIQELEPRCRDAVRKHHARTRRQERPLVQRQDLSVFGGDLAVFTGRPPAELALAFEVLGFRLPAVPDCAPHLRKPRPEGLLQLADAFRARRITFAGDSLDDASSLRAARALRPDLDWTFAAIGPERARFAEPGDLQAATLLEVLPLLEGGSRP